MKIYNVFFKNKFGVKGGKGRRAERKSPGSVGATYG
jgi:hypothetical protein